jgi:hypothetical protein
MTYRHSSTRPRVSDSAAPGFPLVAVAQGTAQDTPAQILQTALQGLGGIGRFVKPGQTVAIKPNATWAYPPGTASSTDPDFLTAVIQAVRDAGAGRIIVMDHCSIEPGAAESVQISGIGQVVKKTGVESLFPDRYDAPPSTYTKIDLPQGRANKKIGVIKAAVEADVRINLAVPKSHNVAKLTMCLKHMMGFLQQPGLLHVSLEQGIADLNTPSPVQAHLHLLEAIRVRKPHGSYQVCAGPETELTHPEIVERRNMVIAGVDPVLIDAYGCIHLFDRKPQELLYVLLANQSGCGDMDVEAALADGRIRQFQVGEPISAAAPSANTTADAAAAATPPSAAPQANAAEPADSAGPGQPVAAALDEANCSPANQVISFGPFVNLALIPAAAIVTGAGLLILNRMRRRLPLEPPMKADQQSRTSQTSKDEGRD